MSEAWREQDRERAPCSDCGTALYEKFWGNAGWVPTELVTERSHGSSDCVRVLKVRLTEEKKSLVAQLVTRLRQLAVKRDPRIGTPEQPAADEPARFLNGVATLIELEAGDG